MNLALTDKQAQRLINLAKTIIKKCKIDLLKHPNGLIMIAIKGKPNIARFNLYYSYAIGEIHFNFLDTKTNLTLVRINLDNKFHKNADGKKISGNRVELFSSKEFFEKNDGVTQVKAYKLPYKTLNNPTSFSEGLAELLDYTQVKDTKKLKIQPEIISG